LFSYSVLINVEEEWVGVIGFAVN